MCWYASLSELIVVLSATSRGLEATFQWSHDSRYYLTAKTTGIPIALEKPGSAVSNKHRFMIKSSNTCRDCVTIKSVATGRYLASTKDGQVISTTNRKLRSTLFNLHTCNPALIILCPFMDVSCAN
ncbi:hypothetical protein QZH41_009885 [Actinostola sp. cb2023]|nr:hypothetical protein QZH41_009885 [Actinostola sp. cb2023]